MRKMADGVGTGLKSADAVSIRKIEKELKAGLKDTNRTLAENTKLNRTEIFNILMSNGDAFLRVAMDVVLSPVHMVEEILSDSEIRSTDEKIDKRIQNFIKEITNYGEKAVTLGIIGGSATSILANKTGGMNGSPQYTSDIKRSAEELKKSIESTYLREKDSIEKIIKEERKSAPVKLSGDKTEDIKDTVITAAKDIYDKKVDEDRGTSKKVYEWTTHGSQTKGKIGGNFRYTKTNDVEKLYGDYEKGKNVMNTSGSYTHTAQNIQIHEGASKSAIDINLNSVEMKANMAGDIRKGNVYASAGAEWDVASLGLTTGETDNGSGAVHVKAGVGASGTIGFQDGVLSVKGSVAILLGADIDIKLNLENIWKDINAAFPIG